MNDTEARHSPTELVDSYLWAKHTKIITRDHHHISGLRNFSHLNRLTSEPSTPMHYHTGILELHCLAKGIRNCCLLEGGERHVYACTGGEAFAVFPGEIHSAGNGVQSPCDFYALQLDLRESDRFLNLDAPTGTALCSALTQLRVRRLRVPAEDLDLLRHAFELFSEATDTARSAGVAFLVCFLYRLLGFECLDAVHISEETEAARTPEVHDPGIRAALGYISDNIREPLSLSEVASVSGYSLSHFKTRFREVTGDTPASYITDQKVAEAKRLLRETSLPITDIAVDLGWSTSNYFCSVFRKITGTSPLHYRKKHLT